MRDVEQRTPMAGWWWTTTSSRRCVQNADGLPLYVRFVVEDLLAGEFTR